MQVNAGKLQILTVAAMLVIVSGGIAAYAQAQSASAGSTPAGGVPVALAGGDTNSTSTSSTNSTSTSTSTSTTSTTANQTLCQPTTPIKVGRLILPITAAATTTGGISFSNDRGCYASITTVGGIFNVQVLLRYAKPVTQYNVVLVANGTSYTLGNMVTGPGGNGQMDNQVLLTAGTYAVSLQIYDTSSSPGHSVLVLSTGQGTITSPPFPTVSSSQPPIPGGQNGQGHSGQHK
ncbi:MAG: hypothetical protein OK442_00745 [Thaumarchaeota archaeon]|nr:hypothetical protein [Nitrososphaerota archaeon]